MFCGDIYLDILIITDFALIQHALKCIKMAIKLFIYSFLHLFQTLGPYKNNKMK